MDDFTKGYIEAALWSSTDENCVPLDSIYAISDFAPETIQQIETDCKQFWSDNETLIGYAGISERSAGIDFWLTRNGHGAGFWDRGLGVIGQILTKRCRPFGEVNLYVGNDKKLYFL